MTNTQRRKLADLIAGKTGKDSEIATAVATESVTLVSRVITSRTLANELGLLVAGGLLNKLDLAIRDADEPIKSALATAKGWLDPAAGGIDVGDPKTRAQLELLLQVGFSTEELATIKGLGEINTLDFTPTAADVAEAKELAKRITAQDTARRALADAYNRRADFSDRITAQLESGELAEVFTDLGAL